MGYPTVESGTRDRGSYAQPSGILIGREDTEYANKLFQEIRWKNPASLITMQNQSRGAKTEEVHWFTDERLPYLDQINYGTGYNSSATSLVVDNISHFKVSNVVRDDNSGENMFVYAIDTANSAIHVIRDAGQATESWTAKAASIADDAWLKIVGTAAAPGESAVVAKSTKDVERWNAMQEFKHTVDITERSNATGLRGPQDLSTQERKAATDHAEEMEMAFFDGKPWRNNKGVFSAHSSSDAPGTAGGIEHFMEEYGDSDKLVDETELTEFEFYATMEKMLDKTRTITCYCPDALLFAMSRWGIMKQTTYDVTTMLGMKIGFWQSTAGDVIFVSHDYLKALDASSWNRAFFIDQEQVTAYFMNKIGTTKYREIVVPNGATKMAWEYHTILTWVWGLMKRHGRLRFKTAA